MRDSTSASEAGRVGSTPTWGIMKLYDVLKIDEAKKLDLALESKGLSPILYNLGDPEVALTFMKACLRGSYLFGRHVVPTYVSHAFTSLTRRSPVKDDVGKTLKKLVDMCVGELCTNNIYEREGECHSHFNDLYEAYAFAGGDLKEFDSFMGLAEDHRYHRHAEGTLAAIHKSHAVWGTRSAQFATKLLDLCDDPFASFIIMPCNETLTTVIYPVAIKHLSREDRFSKFKKFLEVHIDLDGNDHGYIAIEWLESYLALTNPAKEIKVATTNKVLSLYEKVRTQ